MSKWTDEVQVTGVCVCVCVYVFEGAFYSALLGRYGTNDTNYVGTTILLI